MSLAKERSGPGEAGDRARGEAEGARRAGGHGGKGARERRKQDWRGRGAKKKRTPASS